MAGTVVVASVADGAALHDGLIAGGGRGVRAAITALDSVAVLPAVVVVVLFLLLLPPLVEK